MQTIVQVEYRPGLLTVREEILQFLGNPVLSVFGSQAARELDLSDKDVGVVLIWSRCGLGRAVSVDFSLQTDTAENPIRER